MVRALEIIVLLLAVSTCASAQSAPKAEVFGGYQYFRLDTGVSGVDKFNLNGWNASLNGYFNNHLGITADFGGAYGTPAISSIATPSGIGIQTKIHTFMFGPVVRLTNPTRITPFVHALGGGVHASGIALGFSSSGTDAAWAVGGGLDANIASRIGIRLGQFDFLQTRLGDSHQNNFRFSAGVVFRF